ncbi:hypothetical protein BO224_09370 [Erysipelotrichaceae bacterium NYU-BL-E8]|uniref:Uncharacterized protein n=1 Tax=Ileibacterium valens TaxID=1862668 RepID=A0A1U7NFX9_9FIRM|nr:hypothetical protein BO224_09370 [Erysipelotrichaceae bacterium NYU-BL-E8]OLU39562.1 hypothetical protein BO222_06370 [Ileibacterium valens]
MKVHSCFCSFLIYAMNLEQKQAKKKSGPKDELSSRYHLRYKSPISSGSFVHSSSIHCEMKMNIN